MRISDWSSDVCSSDLLAAGLCKLGLQRAIGNAHEFAVMRDHRGSDSFLAIETGIRCARRRLAEHQFQHGADDVEVGGLGPVADGALRARSEEHTSELQSLMRISYAVFCLKKKTQTTNTEHSIKIHPSV